MTTMTTMSTMNTMNTMSRGVRWAVLCWSGAAALQAAALPPCAVEMRAGDTHRDGFLVREGEDGITLAQKDDPSSTTVEIRWDEIESLVADGASADRSRRIQQGLELWRGRTRLARGDLRGARAAFLRALEVLPPDATLLRQMAEEGVARTARADPADGARSLVAALATAVARGGNTVPRQWIGGDDGVDIETGLVLGVPPAWTDGTQAKKAQVALAVARDAALTRGDNTLATFCEWVGKIAAADAGEPLPGEASRTSEGRGTSRQAARLLEAWADAVSADAPARKRGRQVLQAIVKSAEGGRRLWALYALGRSQAMEDDPDTVRLGVGRMLTIAAAHAGECPSLATAALAQAAIALARIQDDHSAALLREMTNQSGTSPIPKE